MDLNNHDTPSGIAASTNAGFESLKPVDLDTLDIDKDTRTILQRLQDQGFDQTDLSSHLIKSPKRLAAVLVLLYSQPTVNGFSPSIRVLLTTRSKSLRSHPGQTALPGGRIDDDDREPTVLWGAFREAYEEVGLPFPLALLESHTYTTPQTSNPTASKARRTVSDVGNIENSAELPYIPNIYILCTLSPHLSQWGLIVVPVIAYLSGPISSNPTSTPHEYFLSPTLTLRANPTEVDRIFTHPLEGVLDPSLASTRDDLSDLAEKGSEYWPYEEELYNSTDRVYPQLGHSIYRMHRFRSVASPIKGLTAEIMLRIAQIAYARSPVASIEQYAPDQIRGFEEIRKALDEYGGTRA
ncbi:hypothetical protein J3R30DRAFT_3701489 [Lentinula aciculospora]|uniref:Nudix hydrolase domain-containing protein n=1 Tax=Lentinula aciculospora TaxID=153920 RepID=A0A9W9DQI5_9AGAR|nr:hypothetical protein J3R30DRAFT_3701489 [Lentinula aciculospora]